MNLINTFRVSFKAILTNKVRSFLTMLGVIIGVSSVVLLISIGRGLEAFITQQFEELGSNNIFISPGSVFGEDGGFSSFQEQGLAAMNLSFKLEDVQEIKKMRQYVDKLTYYNAQSDEISFLDETKNTTILGTNANYNQVLITDLDKGRFFNQSEADSGEKVAVIGFKIYEELFGEIDPIGKKIKIGSTNFEVVGVAEQKGGGSLGGPSFDTYAYIPFETLSRLYDTDKIMDMAVKARPEAEIEDAIAALENNMLKRYEDDEFSVYDQSELLSVINDILGMLTVALGGIAAISLVVGGIGIMNIMLVSVTERTKEIGLRKALGATPNQILLQFLIEAALLSILGGLIGLGLAFLGSLALQNYFPAKVTWDAVILAFGVSTIVGLVFGAAPARRASKLSPIEALRYE
ncbi:MAG: FtsX-like permease family protein [Candidatus Pacebacteria bacterium]|nr:FtsX-like permease family protein [Candidatus Paceibacterota bacterium]